MAGTHDRLVNVPIAKDDIQKTLEKLPHTPSEAGIITVNLKRKLNMKTHHVQQLINTHKVFNCLEYLSNQDIQVTRRNLIHLKNLKRDANMTMSTA